jgi:hypothetical protein
MSELLLWRYSTAFDSLFGFLDREFSTSELVPPA